MVLELRFRAVEPIERLRLSTMAMIGQVFKPLVHCRKSDLDICRDHMRPHTAYLATFLVLPYLGCANSDREAFQVWPVSSPSNVYVDSIPAASQTADEFPQVATVAFQAPENSQNRLSNADPDGSDKTAATPTSQANDFGIDHEISNDLIVDTTVAGKSYTLADMEQMALGNNPAMAAAAVTASKAAGLRAQVGVRPNPTIGYFGQQIADRNTDQHGLFVEQEYVRGNKLELNRAVLSQTTLAQNMEIETQRNRVLTDVRVRFFEAVAAQMQLDAIQDFMLVANRGVQVAEDRKEAQEGTMIEILQSQTLLSEITLAAERTELTYRGAWKDLAAIVGLPVSTPVRLVSELPTPGIAPIWDNVFTDIVAQSPELSVANALVCEKAALLKRQRVQMVPNITGQFGAGYDNGTDSGMINLQVSAPIPVWNTNSGNISAAYHDYTRALENVKRIEQSIKSRLARVSQDFDVALATVNKYQQEIIPQAEQSLQLSEEAYQAGELDFLQVLVVRRSFYESRIRQIEALGQLAQANAKIDGLLLTGGLDLPEDYTDGDGIRGASFGGQ